MKILFVLELFYPNIGGIEKLFASLGESLVQQGNEVKVITTRFQKGLPLKETYRGMEVRRLPIHNRFLFTFFGFFFLHRDAGRSDIIHTTSYNAAFPARMAALLHRKPCVITFHEVWGKLWFRLPYLSLPGRILYSLYEQFILRLRFHRFVGVSQFTSRRLQENGVSQERITTIYNGLDYNKNITARPNPGEVFIFTFFGRPGSSKGLDILLPAAEDFLKKENRKLRLILSKSPAAIYRKVIRYINNAGIAGKVELMHHLSDNDLERALLESHCIVIPSYSEGFCFAAAEASALGIPLITSGKGALPEVVSGRHITLENMSPSALGKALEQAEEGKWMETPLKKFELQDTVNSYKKLYDSLLS
ncbi:MAG: glycosyltransferase family 4 protein [Bacteroidetes bacterium]|nr:glycosyltransferase family 4 protein [Bacteroidota bacterium]